MGFGAAFGGAFITKGKLMIKNSALLSTKSLVLGSLVALAVLIGPAAAQCQGTESLFGDDFGLNISQGLSSVNSLQVPSGSDVTLNTATITFDGLPYFLVVEFLPSGMNPNGLTSGICVSGDPSTTLIIPAGILLSEWTPFTFNYGGGLAGITGHAQSIVLNAGSQAGNGDFVSSDPVQLIFQ